MTMSRRTIFVFGRGRMVVFIMFSPLLKHGTSLNLSHQRFHAIKEFGFLKLFLSTSSLHGLQCITDCRPKTGSSGGILKLFLLADYVTRLNKLETTCSLNVPILRKSGEEP
uniref:Uncharacterized protein n=1 Tax=Brassica oleracea TaxID=3712 RepID=A0A3P6DCD6_BRAOL|nr:unnamed protein product [Brassica oleracea]